MELSFDSLDTPALTKADIALLLFDQIGLNKRESKDFIDAFFELIVTELVAGRDVKISGLGILRFALKMQDPGVTHVPES